jgi:hypothetical protein
MIDGYDPTGFVTPPFNPLSRVPLGYFAPEYMPTSPRRDDPTIPSPRVEPIEPVEPVEPDRPDAYLGPALTGPRPRSTPDWRAFLDPPTVPATGAGRPMEPVTATPISPQARILEDINRKQAELDVPYVTPHERAVAEARQRRVGGLPGFLERLWFGTAINPLVAGAPWQANLGRFLGALGGAFPGGPIDRYQQQRAIEAISQEHEIREQQRAKHQQAIRQAIATGTEAYENFAQADKARQDALNAIEENDREKVAAVLKNHGDYISKQIDFIKAGGGGKLTVRDVFTGEERTYDIQPDSDWKVVTTPDYGYIVYDSKSGQVIRYAGSLKDIQSIAAAKAAASARAERENPLTAARLAEINARTELLKAKLKAEQDEQERRQQGATARPGTPGEPGGLEDAALQRKFIDEKLGADITLPPFNMRPERDFYDEEEARKNQNVWDLVYNAHQSGNVLNLIAALRQAAALEEEYNVMPTAEAKHYNELAKMIEDAWYNYVRHNKETQRAR